MSEKLIYAMSTNSSMRIPQFNKYFRESYQNESPDMDESINLRHQMIRVLDSLAYCEFDYNKNMVYMCKPALVLLPVFGLPKALLVGARIPTFINKLKKTVKKQEGKAIISYHNHAKININIPPAVYIEAISKNVLKDIAVELHIGYHIDVPAAWSLSYFSDPISKIKNNLSFEKQKEPNWKRYIFNPEFLFFTRKVGDITEELTLAQYRNPINRQYYHMLWNGDKAAEVKRDWGRYLVLSDQNSRVLLFDENTFQLAVPGTVPLPCILARALALCTGVAPIMKRYKSQKNSSIPNNYLIRIYSGVTPVIASLVASKLGQKLVKASFKFDRW